MIMDLNADAEFSVNVSHMRSEFRGGNGAFGHIPFSKITEMIMKGE